MTNRFGTSGTILSQYAATYDEWGNITRLEDTAAKANGKSESIRTYEYNDYGEVTKAVESYENGQKNTYTYSYDAGGNILTETVNSTKHTYKYDSVWKDKLISYDGKTITYNELGCPVNYMGSTMKWDVNGSLSEIKKGGTTITYTYMGDGQRRSKTVNGVTTTYHYNNGMLLSQITGDETLRYYYDNGGKAASVVYSKGNGEERSYFYVRNLQGDVIGICRSSDSKLIGTYEYDLWGKPIGIKEATPGIDTDGILTKNPLRYRSYYYDSETGFYNLNARYYDPAIRRFISADSPTVLMIATVSLDCKNLFSYAENNPVMAKDSSGGVVETVFDVITIGISVVDVCCNPTDPWAWVGLAGDCIDLIPFITGVGEGVKGLKVVVKIANKTADVADAVNDGKKVVKAADKVSDSVRQLDNVSDAAKAAKKSGSGSDLDGIRIINKKYAGKTYELSGDLATKYPNGVKFSNEGFPDFEPYSIKKVTVDNLEGDAYYDFIKANEAAGYSSTPTGFTWHHVEDGRTMLLVPSDLHGAVRHTGGASLIRKGIRP